MNRTRAAPGLLVSVRSAAEALVALEGGADLIDVKEPSRGPMGSADADVIETVVRAVAGRTPVSAAFGEWVDWKERPIPAGLSFAKWGLSRLAESCLQVAVKIRHAAGSAAPVLVAYADFERGQSPDPDLVAWDACDIGLPVFLIDTAVKDGSTLLDHIDPITLERIRRRLQHAGVKVAFAGSLDASAIRQLAPLEPEWFAVRGAVCVGGREGTISAVRVRQLKETIAAG
jgi:(5-formylfuran-3-yl)methyl phosphate synthase